MEELFTLKELLHQGKISGCVLFILFRLKVGGAFQQ